MKKTIPTQQLTRNYTISRLIKGGWQLAGGHGLIDRSQAIADMYDYVRSGIVTFDSADIYTGVEKLIGDFLQEYQRKEGRKNMLQVRIHTKFVPDLDRLSTISRSYVQTIIDRSLQRLNVERLDMVQFHWWDYDIQMYGETALYLQELQKAGKIRALSVTNFDVIHLQELVSAGINIVSNQVQYSVLDHRPEHGMIRFCRKYGISLLCYGSLAGGFLSERYLGMPEPNEPLENRSLTKYSLIIQEFGGWKLFQELLMTLHSIGKKHNTTISSVAMRYVLEQETVAAIIVGARTVHHLQSYQNLFTFSLDQEDKQRLEAYGKKSQGPNGDIYSVERKKGSSHASIMKYNLNSLF